MARKRSPREAREESSMMTSMRDEAAARFGPPAKPNPLKPRAKRGKRKAKRVATTTAFQGGDDFRNY